MTSFSVKSQSLPFFLPVPVRHENATRTLPSVTAFKDLSTEIGTKPSVTVV